MSYEATVTRLVNVRVHPNADKILLATAQGSQVVVSLASQEADLGVFFPADGQLSEEFVLANRLYSRAAFESLGHTHEEGNRYGFFDLKRRVRCQSFRGQKSEGFWVPLDYFTFLGDTSVLTEGYSFDTFNGVPICNKYITKQTKQASLMKLGKRQRENVMFPKHDVTQRWKHVSHDLPKDGVVYLTEKLHGTSGRFGNVLDDIDRPLLTKAWNKFSSWVNSTFMLRLPYVPAQEYRHLNGSKNVILEKSTGAGWYGTNDFRYNAIDGLTLKKGEVIYFEIVGSFQKKGSDSHAPTFSEIMESQPIRDEVKSLRKIYGDTMHYTYGTTPGQPAIYVYKIVLMNEDGYGVEYSWNQLVGRCLELGLKHVPLLSGPVRVDENLDSLVEELTEGPSTLDSSHIREGIVVRVESPAGIQHVKNKSWYFGVLEGYLKDSEEYVDMEESS